MPGMAMNDRPRRVLVAEDGLELRESVAMVLRSVGFDVAIAGDGRELLQAFDEGRPRPDVVLADVQMPHVDGVEAMRRLRESGVETPFVFVTGIAGSELASVKRCLGSQDELVLKPFYISEVLAAVGRATNRPSASASDSERVIERPRGARQDGNGPPRTPNAAAGSCEEA